MLTPTAMVPYTGPVAEDSLVIVIDGHCRVRIDHNIINMADKFQKASTAGESQLSVEGCRLIWTVILTAMRGTTDVPRGLLEGRIGAQLVYAMLYADKVQAKPEVMDNIATMITKHFAALKTWKYIDCSAANARVHVEKVFEICYAWKAYTSLPPTVEKPFHELGFALLFESQCPGLIIDRALPFLDPAFNVEYARISNMRRNGFAIPASAWKLVRV